MKKAESSSSMTTRKKVILCAQEALERKAKDLVILNVGKLTSFTDYFVICSGRSSRQVQTIAENVVNKLGEVGVHPLHVEGRREGHWVLIDYGDLVVHIFFEPIRSIYDLESLWSDAEQVPITGSPAAS